jgi:hypothetical protein
LQAHNACHPPDDTAETFHFWVVAAEHPRTAAQNPVLRCSQKTARLAFLSGNGGSYYFIVLVKRACARVAGQSGLSAILNETWRFIRGRFGAWRQERFG